jgi:hypothetical protein
VAAHGSAGPPAGATTEPAAGDRLDPARPAPYSPADFRLDLDKAVAKGMATGGSTLGPTLGRGALLDSSVPTPRSASADAPLETLLRPLVWDRLTAEEPVSPPVGVVAEPEPVVIDPVLADEVVSAEVVSDEVVSDEVVPDEVVPDEIVPDPLADVPDAVDVPAAVLPPIVSNEPEVASIATTPATGSIPAGGLPVLAAMPVVAPVPAAQPRRPVVFEPTRPVAPPARRRRRRVLPKLLAVLVVAAGGAFAVSRYLLEVPTWDGEVRPLADEVATLRGLTFRDPVTVEEIPLDSYVTALAATVLPADAAARDRLAGSWRALGLIDAGLDAAALGRQAAVDMPAFYDRTRGVVVVAAGMGGTLRSFAVERALTWALLDQHVNWGPRVATGSASEALAIRAAVDADALVVARAAIGTPAEQQQLTSELAAWTESVLGDADVDGSWLTAMIGRPGAALAPVMANTVGERRDGLLAATGLNDGAVFDTARGFDATLSSLVTDPSSTRGLIQWYQVLASRLDPAEAWAAATAWAGDTTAVTVETDGQVCVTALVTAADAAGGLRLQQAFERWSALAPAASATTVAAVGERQVSVRACDPTAVDPAPTDPASQPAPVDPPAVTSVGVPFGGASIEASVVARAMLVVADLPATVRTCLVDRVRATVTSLAPADVAPVVVPAVGWTPPALAAFDVNAEVTACQATP